MLSLFSRRSMPLIAGLLLWLLTGTSLQAQPVIDKIIAKVDNHILLKSELEVSYLQFIQNQELPPGTDMATVKCTVLETLLLNKVLLAKAEIDSVIVDEQTIENELDRRMDYFIRVIGSKEKLEMQYGKTVDELKSELRPQIREQLTIQKMQETISGKISVTPAEVKKFFNGIPKDSLPFFSTEVEVGQIIVVPQVNKQQKLEAKEQALKLREKILAGEDFCMLAKYYSHDKASAEQCGEIGWFEKGQLVDQYEQMALRLKPGETSEIVESQFGYHLIQLIDRKGSTFNTRHILIRPSSSDADFNDAYRLLDSIRTKIVQDSISFEKATKLRDKEKFISPSSGMMQNQDIGGTKIELENIDPSIYFIIDTMNVGQISYPVRFTMEDGNDAMRIVWYKSKTPPHRANLKDDYQKIQKVALEEKKSNALNEWFDKVKKQVFIDIDDEYRDCELMILKE